MINLENASPIEQLWSAISLLAMLLHGYLSIQAYFDWRAVCGMPDREHWRCSSAGHYCLGQILLFVPQVLFLYIGAVSMTLPAPVVERREQIQEVFQVMLISAEVMFALAAAAFWLARRLLEHRDAEHIGQSKE